MPREVDADKEEFVLKIENENGEITTASYMARPFYEKRGYTVFTV